MSPHLHFYSQAAGAIFAFGWWWAYAKAEVPEFLSVVFLMAAIACTVYTVCFNFIHDAFCPSCGTKLTRNRLNRSTGWIFKRHEYAIEYRCPHCRRVTFFGWYDDSND